MSMSLAVAINIVLDAAIVLAVLAVLGWGMRAQVRDMELGVVDRRHGSERRRAAGPVAVHAERRRAEGRDGRSVVA